MIKKSFRDFSKKPRAYHLLEKLESRILMVATIEYEWREAISGNFNDSDKWIVHNGPNDGQRVAPSGSGYNLKFPAKLNHRSYSVTLTDDVTCLNLEILDRVASINLNGHSINATNNITLAGNNIVLYDSTETSEEGIWCDSLTIRDTVYLDTFNDVFVTSKISVLDKANATSKLIVGSSTLRADAATMEIVGNSTFQLGTTIDNLHAPHIRSVTATISSISLGDSRPKNDIVRLRDNKTADITVMSGNTLTITDDSKGIRADGKSQNVGIHFYDGAQLDAAKVVITRDKDFEAKFSMSSGAQWTNGKLLSVSGEEGSFFSRVDISGAGTVLEVEKCKFADFDILGQGNVAMLLNDSAVFRVTDGWTIADGGINCNVFITHATAYSNMTFVGTTNGRQGAIVVASGGKFIAVTKPHPLDGPSKGMIVLGHEAGSSGSLTIEDGGVVDTGSIQVGSDGDAYLNIWQRGKLYSLEAYIATGKNSSATIDISGEETSWSNSAAPGVNNRFRMGRGGNVIMHLSDHAKLETMTLTSIAYDTVEGTDVSVNINVDNATWTTGDGDVLIGDVNTDPKKIILNFENNGKMEAAVNAKINIKKRHATISGDGGIFQGDVKTYGKDNDLRPGNADAPFGKLRLEGDLDASEGVTYGINIGASESSSYMEVVGDVELCNASEAFGDLYVTALSSDTESYFANSVINNSTYSNFTGNLGDFFTVLSCDGLFTGEFTNMPEGVITDLTALSKLPNFDEVGSPWYNPGRTWSIAYNVPNGETHEIRLTVVPKVVESITSGHMEDIMPDSQRSLSVEGFVGAGYGYGYGSIHLNEWDGGTIDGSDSEGVTWTPYTNNPFTLTVGGGTAAFTMLGETVNYTYSGDITDMFIRAFAGHTSTSISLGNFEINGLALAPSVPANHTGSPDENIYRVSGMPESFTLSGVVSLTYSTSSMPTGNLGFELIFGETNLPPVTVDSSINTSGEVTLAWGNLSSNTTEMQITRSDDGGESWTELYTTSSLTGSTFTDTTGSYANSIYKVNQVQFDWLDVPTTVMPNVGALNVTLNDDDDLAGVTFALDAEDSFLMNIYVDDVFTTQVNRDRISQLVVNGTEENDLISFIGLDADLVVHGDDGTDSISVIASGPTLSYDGDNAYNLTVEEAYLTLENLDPYSNSIHDLTVGDNAYLTASSDTWHFVSITGELEVKEGGVLATGYNGWNKYNSESTTNAGIIEITGGGYMSVYDASDFINNGEINVSGNNFSLSGGTLTNNGKINVIDGGLGSASLESTWINNGEINIEGNSSFYLPSYETNTAHLTNNGRMKLQVFGAYFSEGAITNNGKVVWDVDGGDCDLLSIDNQGEITLENSEMDLSGATLTSGSYIIGDGATVLLDDDLTLDGATLSVELGGTLDLSVAELVTSEAIDNFGTVLWGSQSLADLAWINNDGVISFEANTAIESETFVSGTYQIGSGAVVTADDDLVIPSGVTLIVKGDLDVDGEITVNGTLIVESGEVDADAITNDGVLSWSGGDILPDISNSDFGLINWDKDVLTGFDKIVANDGLVALNGEIDLSSFTFPEGRYEINGVVDNDGTMDFDPVDTTVTNYGVINWNDSDLTLLADIGGNGTIMLTVGDAITPLNLDGLPTEGNLKFELAEEVVATFTANFTLGSGNTLTIGEDAELLVDDVDFVNEGIVKILGGTFGAYSGTIVNDGLIVFGEDADIDLDTSTFTNNGTINWMTSNIADLLAVGNSGTIVLAADVDLSGKTLSAGEYVLDWGVTATVDSSLTLSGADLVLSPFSTLDLSAGTLTASSGVPITNEGTILWGADAVADLEYVDNQGTIVFTENVALATADLVSGEYVIGDGVAATAADDLTISEGVTLTIVGELDVDSDDVDVASGGVLNLVGGELIADEVTNAGDFNWHGGELTSDVDNDEGGTVGWFKSDLEGFASIIVNDGLVAFNGNIDLSDFTFPAGDYEINGVVTNDGTMDFDDMYTTLANNGVIIWNSDNLSMLADIDGDGTILLTVGTTIAPLDLSGLPTTGELTFEIASGVVAEFGSNFTLASGLGLIIDRGVSLTTDGIELTNNGNIEVFGAFEVDENFVNAGSLGLNVGAALSILDIDMELGGTINVYDAAAAITLHDTELIASVHWFSTDVSELPAIETSASMTFEQNVDLNGMTFTSGLYQMGVGATLFVDGNLTFDGANLGVYDGSFMYLTGGLLTLDSGSVFNMGGAMDVVDADILVTGTAFIWGYGDVELYDSTVTIEDSTTYSGQSVNWTVNDGSVLDVYSYFRNAGTLNVNTGGSLIVQSGGVFTNEYMLNINGGTFESEGTVNWSSSDFTALLDIDNDGIVELYNGLDGATLTNGIFQIAAETSLSVSVGLTLTGDARLKVPNGTTLSVNSEATVTIGADSGNGYLQVNGSLSVYGGGEIVFSGTSFLAGSGNVTLAEGLMQIETSSQSFLGYEGVINIDEDGAVEIAGVLMSYGTINVNSGGTLSIVTGGQFILCDTGVLNIDGGTVTNAGTIRWEISDVSELDEVDNNGTFIFAANCDFSSLALDSGSTFEIASGVTVTLGTNWTNNGLLIVNSGATLAAGTGVTLTNHGTIDLPTAHDDSFIDNDGIGIVNFV